MIAWKHFIRFEQRFHSTNRMLSCFKFLFSRSQSSLHFPLTGSTKTKNEFLVNQPVMHETHFFIGVLFLPKKQQPFYAHKPQTFTNVRRIGFIDTPQTEFEKKIESILTIPGLNCVFCLLLFFFH